jgi:hypothetical protein
MHHPLGDPFAVEVRDLLDEVVILQRGRPAVPHRPHALVVRDRVPLARGQRSGLRALRGVVHAALREPGSERLDHFVVHLSAHTRCLSFDGFAASRLWLLRRWCVVAHSGTIA